MTNVVPAPPTDLPNTRTDPTYGGSKNRFETYVKAKDLNLWHIILNGDFPPLAKDKVTQILEVVPFEEQSDDLKKKLSKNNEAKMVLYNALPKKEYERIDNKINILVQQYEQFFILEEESIVISFARFNTIITSLKALNEGFSSKNYVRKFLRALHPKWRAKVTEIKESKDLSSLTLDELIDNLKVHEVVMKKNSKIYRGKKERVMSIVLKAKKESIDNKTLTSRSDDEEYAMTGRVTEKALDAVIQIISLAIIQNQLATKIKRPSLEVIEAITKMMPKTKLTIKLVSWLNRKMCKAYIVLNKHTIKVEESLDVTFDESPPLTKLSPIVDDDVAEEEAIRNNTKVVNNNNEEDESIEVDEVKAPKAWYDRLKVFLIKHEYSMRMVDNTLFTKKSKSHLIIVQIYADDIIFGSTSQNLCDDFEKIMDDEFEMSMMGELNFFLGLQIKQIEDGIFFNQSKYINEMLKKFGLEDSKPTKASMSTEIKLTKDDEAESVDSSKYRGDYVDLKSTSGVCTFMGCCLTSWFAKKQTALAISTTEAEYVSAGKVCQQALWMKQVSSTTTYASTMFRLCATIKAPST
nr:retrotransposon protein [Tanacetum cinerariifolium]